VWYSTIGCSIVLIVSLLSSCLLSSQDLGVLEPRLLAPFVSRLLPRLPARLRRGWAEGEEREEEQTTKL